MEIKHMYHPSHNSENGRAAEESKVTLKLLVDTKAKKVLFAEAGKEFVDFLFHILSLPVGTVVKLLTAKGMVGCLGDLCKSIEALSKDYMQPNVTKDAVLKPVVASISAVKLPFMLLNDKPNCTTKKLYGCASYDCYSVYYSDEQGAVCPCGIEMSSQMTYLAPKKGSTTTASSSNNASNGGYVKGVVTYMVMDNLEVKPMSTISGITFINKFNVKDVASLVEKEIQMGLTEGVALLKASLQTKAVLTAVFL